MITDSLAAKIQAAAPTARRYAVTMLLALLAVGSVSGCSLFKKKDDDPPKYKPRLPRDPVEDRIFYRGWRHPSVG